jgi:hypothetical protein
MESLFFNFGNIRRMLEHYEKAAKALDIDIDKIMLDLVRPIIQEEQSRQGRKGRK